MKKMVFIVIAASILGHSIVGAQPSQPKPGPAVQNSTAEQSEGPDTTHVAGCAKSWCVYQLIDGKLIPLEKQPVLLTARAGVDGGVWLTFPHEKSTTRSDASPVLIVKEGGWIEDVSHPITLNRLTVRKGTREISVKDVGWEKMDTHHRVIKKDWVQISAVAELPPGEYAVTIRRSEDITNEDSVFLFGVD